MEEQKCRNGKKKICFLTDFLDLGGLENVVSDAIDGLVEKYDVSIVALYGISREMQTKLGRKVTIHSNVCGRAEKKHDFVWWSMPVIGPMLFRHYIREKYDCLILLRSGLLMAAFSKIAPKVICWSHSEKDMMYANPEKLNLLRKMNKLRLKMGYRKVDATWVVTDSVQKALETAFGVKNVYVLDNPVNCPKIIELSQSGQPNCFDPTVFTFVVVGRLSPEKGHIRALQALYNLQKEFSCKMVIVGDGWMRSSLEEYVQNNSMTDSVFFAGHQPNPYPYIQAADALVLPSEKESFGLVLLEAMILRTPVMTTSTGGGKRVTDMGKYGILVENTVAGIESGMRKCVTTDDQKEKYTESAYQWAWSFDKSHFNQQINELLEM